MLSCSPIAAALAAKILLIWGLWSKYKSLTSRADVTSHLSKMHIAGLSSTYRHVLLFLYTFGLLKYLLSFAAGRWGSLWLHRGAMKGRNSMSASCALQLVLWDMDIQHKPLLAWPFPSDAHVSILFSQPVRHCSIAPNWKGFVKCSELLMSNSGHKSEPNISAVMCPLIFMVKLHLKAELLR